MAFSIAPSGHWLGNDGYWSTFRIGVGTPPQIVELLPATSQQGVFVVVSEACPPEATASCGIPRGGLFHPQDDSTRTPINANDEYPDFTVSFPSGIDLPINISTEVSFTSVALGEADKNEPRESLLLLDQMVIGYASQGIFIGLFGLSNQLKDYFGEQFDSFPQALINFINITSYSWAYTAGAKYKDPDTFGSLTFGGYDASRVDIENALTIPLTNSTSRDFMVAINNIEVHDNAYASGSDHISSRVYPLLASPVLAFLNSAESDIYLPESDCEAIEKQLGLVWNTTWDMYLINITKRESLLESIAAIDFILARDVSSKVLTTIRLPLQAFYQQVKFPLLNITDEEIHYRFALKRAPTPGSITLGRVFFQEAYVIADYGRAEFKVSQALFPLSDSKQLVDILPPSPSQEPPSSSQDPSNKQNLEPGGIAGVVIGAVAALTIIACLVWWLRRRRALRAPRHTSDTCEETTDEHNPMEGNLELPDRGLSELSNYAQIKPELDADASGTAPLERHELQAGSVRRRPGSPAEMP